MLKLPGCYPLIDLPYEAQNAVKNARELVKTISDNPEQLNYATPVTKGALLYRLWSSKEYLREIGLANCYQNANEQNIEKSAFILINSIKSASEWNSTLENMAAVTSGAVMCVPKTYDYESGCLDKTKVENIEELLLNRVRAIFADEHLPALMAYLNQLPE